MIEYPDDCRLYPNGPNAKRYQDAANVNLQCKREPTGFYRPHLWMINTRDMTEVDFTVEAIPMKTDCTGSNTEYAVSENFGVHRFCTQTRGAAKAGDWQSYSLGILTTPVGRADGQSVFRTLFDHSDDTTSIVGVSLSPIGNEEYLLVVSTSAQFGEKGQPRLYRLTIDDLEPIAELDLMQLPIGRECRARRHCNVRGVYTKSDDLFMLFEVFGSGNQRVIAKYQRAGDDLHLVAEAEFPNGRSLEQIQAYSNGLVLMHFADQGRMENSSKIEVWNGESRTLAATSFGDLDTVVRNLSGVALADELDTAILIYQDGSMATVQIDGSVQPRALTIRGQLAKLHPRQIWPTSNPKQFLILGEVGLARVEIKSQK